MIVCADWSDFLFWTLLIAWQVLPFVPVAIGLLERSVSIPGCLLAVGVAGAGTYWSWHFAMTDTSSSTASLIVLWSPLYLVVPVGAVIGADMLARWLVRRRRSSRAQQPAESGR